MTDDREHPSSRTRPCPCGQGCMALIRRTPAVGHFPEPLTYRCRDCRRVETFEERK